MKKLTPKGIVKLALSKKSVSIPSICAKRMPAAFLIGMPFHLVMRYIQSGVFEYKKNK